MSGYKYKIYGLNISSDFPLPELQPSADDATDVKISLGKTPEKLAALSSMGALWQSEDDKLLLDVKEAARFLNIGAGEIIVEPYTEEITQEIRNFLLGAVFGAILAARKMVLLKAGAVWTQSGASLFIGNCGAGKSAMVASLVQKGFPLMADDKVCLVLDAKGIVNVIPAFPQIRLLEHTVRQLNFPFKEEDFRPNFGKMFIPVKEFHDAPAQLKTAYLLAANNKSDLEYVELNQFPEKYEILNANVYMPAFVTAPLTKMTYFSVLSAAAKQISMTMINRPLVADVSEAITVKIAEDLAK